MSTYEIYAVNGFCDSEWGHLGTIQAASPEEMLTQVRANWPGYVRNLLIACTSTSVIPLFTMQQEEPVLISMLPHVR